MARLFTSAADDAFNGQEYRRLCRTYQRLGKTPPSCPAMWTSSGWPSYAGSSSRETDLVPELFAVPTMDATRGGRNTLARLHELMTKRAE